MTADRGSAGQGASSNNTDCAAVWSDLEIAGNHEEVVALQARPAREGQLRVHLPGQLVGLETFDVHGPGLFV